MLRIKKNISHLLNANMCFNFVFIIINNYFFNSFVIFKLFLLNKMCSNKLQHKGQVRIEHLCLFAKNFQHEYQRDLFICLYIIFVRKLLVFFYFIRNALMCVFLSIESTFSNVLNDINIFCKST